ncbi:MAG TPA: hypothetical protein DD435_06950 [Cyanobacteria bacterium UBA8530]|nr:hypothetical protein [Cyanobacteria bacterium UBA8530]
MSLMRKRWRALLIVGLFALPAQARDGYKDVPSGHWAEKAIDEVAIKRHLMDAYPDSTFRGEKPFSRRQFTVALKVLVSELESLSGIPWKAPLQKKHRFQDLSQAKPESKDILILVNDYGLFEGVVGEKAFEGERTITRSEMAKVVHNLLKLGEKKGVLAPLPAGKAGNPFSDLSGEQREVLELTEDYRVMAGFPDHTFRGNEGLTRFQFAATCLQTFPLIRELVRQSVNRHQEEDRSIYFRRDQALGLAFLNGDQSYLEFSGFYYQGPLFGFHKLGIISSAQPSLWLGLGPKTPLLGATQFQPYVDGRVFWQGADRQAGLGAGVILHQRFFKNWGCFGNIELNSAYGTLQENEAGLEYLGGRWGIALAVKNLHWDLVNSAWRRAAVNDVHLGCNWSF